MDALMIFGLEVFLGIKELCELNAVIYFRVTTNEPLHVHVHALLEGGAYTIHLLPEWQS